MKLIKFGAEWCGYCKGMERARTVEKFIDANPSITLVSYHNAEDGDEADKMMEQYDVGALPAFIWEDDEGNVAHISEGATSLAGLGKQMKVAQEAIESGDYGADKRKRRGKKR